MTNKEIVHITEKNSATSEVLEPMIEKFMLENPDVSYVRVNQDEEPELAKVILPSRPPIVSPFFIGLVGGKVNGTASGMISEQDLGTIVK
jgi:hypothetical protein